jgi:uncharacterized membrane protein YjfL (UPF0719 family)
MDEVLAAVGMVPRFVIGALFLVLGRVAFERMAGVALFSEVSEKRNAAAGAWVAGHLIGLGFALRGALFGGGELLDVLIAVAVGGGLSLVLLPAGSWLVDRAVLHRFDARREVAEDRNVGTGVVLGASAIATGLVLDGALSGHSDGLLIGLRDVGIYFAAAQGWMMLAALVYTKIAPFDVHHAIEHHDSAAAGFALGGFLLAIGVVVRASVAGAGSDLVNELSVILVDGAVGLVLLAGTSGLAGRLLLRAPVDREIGQSHNAAAGVVLGAAYVAIALVLTGALRP